MDIAPSFHQHVTLAAHFEHDPAQISAAKPVLLNQRQSVRPRKLYLRFACRSDDMDMRRFMIVRENHKTKVAQSMDGDHQ
jgi:hypothetical protein